MLPLQKGRILYECKGSGISSNKAYKVYEQYNKREGKSLILVKAEELGMNRFSFLKLIRLNTSEPENEIKNIKDAMYLQREGKFQFYYPYIEQVYGSKFLYTKHNDGSRDYYFGVSVEYVEGKNVEEARKEYGDAELTREQEISIFRNILQFLYGMRYYLNYADKKYLHRDLKPENVMIDAYGNVKIIDFDYAHISGSTDTQTIYRECGFSSGYTSPAPFEIKRFPDEQDEFYSAGRLIFYWLNGRPYYTRKETYGDHPEKSLYCKDPALGYGTKTERFRKEYQTPEYEAFRDILDKMCHSPSSKEKYGNIEEIIKDFVFFLKSKYEITDSQLESLMNVESVPLLGNNLTKFESKEPFVYRKINGRKEGKKLPQYCMRDIKVDGIIAMTIYNVDGEIYYIPAGKTKRREIRENEDYRIRNQDVFVTQNQTEITFSLER